MMCSASTPKAFQGALLLVASPPTLLHVFTQSLAFSKGHPAHADQCQFCTLRSLLIFKNKNLLLAHWCVTPFTFSYHSKTGFFFCYQTLKRGSIPSGHLQVSPSACLPQKTSLQSVSQVCLPTGHLFFLACFSSEAGKMRILQRGDVFHHC